jgi:hypothetical protein
MQRLLEMIGVIVILLAVLRFSLVRRQGFGLHSGLTGLNVITGALAGAAVGVILRDLRPWEGFAAPLGARVEAAGYGSLADALTSLLPLAGAAFGGIVAYHFLGMLWRRLLQNGTAAARATLRRVEFAVTAVALIFLIHRMVA